MRNKARIMAVGTLLLVFAVVAQAQPAPNADSSWAGTYEFAESAPPNQMWGYELTVSLKDNALTAQLNVDGFQTMRQINCTAVVEGTKLLVMFLSYGPEDVHYSEALNPGQVVLTLERAKNGSLLTHWGAISAQLETNQASGKEYFKRNENQAIVPPAEAPPPAVPQPSADAQATGGKKGVVEGVLYFKGLHLGMGLKEATAVLDKLGMQPDRNKDGGYEVTKVPMQDGLVQVSRSPYPNKALKAWQVIAVDDTEKRVVQFTFDGKSASALFGLGDMTGLEFAKMFCDAYGISSLENCVGNTDAITNIVLKQPTKQGGMYRDRANGWKLAIFEDKELRITAISKTQQTKFD